MKRSGPPVRRTPLRTDLTKQRAWERRSRKPLPSRSAKRRAESKARTAIRAWVLRRDGACVAGPTGRRLLPEVACASPWPDRPALEVHEVVPRGRGGDYLSADNCVALCQAHHDHVTANPARATEVGLLASAQPLADVIAPADRCRWCGGWHVVLGVCHRCDLAADTWLCGACDEDVPTNVGRCPWCGSGYREDP